MPNEPSNGNPVRSGEESLNAQASDISEAEHYPDVEFKPEKTNYLKKIWRRYGQIILLILTVLTTLYVGLETVVQFDYLKNPQADIFSSDLFSLFTNPKYFFATILYAIALLGFLTAHEMGHYLTCRKYGIAATLPWYLPNPFIFGSFGAVIRIKSPIRSKKALFDVGIAGPLAGFAVAVPVLFVGLMQSIVIPEGAMSQFGDGADFLTLGDPLLLQFFSGILYHFEGDYTVIISPLGMVGWFACLVTAINLLPVSQLDGGHIFYAVFGKKHYFVSVGILVAMLVLSIVFDYYGWLLWGLLIVLLGLRHPPVPDNAAGLGTARLGLAFIALVIFIICFVPIPIQLS